MSSSTAKRAEFTKLAPAFIAAALIARRRSAFTFVDTRNGLFVIGVCQVSTTAGTGTRTTGSFWRARFAFAVAAATPAIRAMVSLSTLLPAAKPQTPSTSTRTPNPKASSETVF